MNKICLLIAIYAMSCFALSAQPKERHETPVRDISKYDTIGPFVLGNEPAFENDYKRMGEIRSFIWEHWHDRRRGWLSATFYTIEGDKTVSKFFVEPDETGAWHVLIDSQSLISLGLPKPKRPKRVIRHQAYDQLDWVERNCNINEHCVSLTEQALKDPPRYRLLLENRHLNARDLL